MTRLACYHPFAILAALTIAIPLVWRLSGLDYDQAPLGTGLAAASYLLTLPVQVVLGALYATTGAQPSNAVGLLGWSIVIAAYLGLDYRWARLAKARKDRSAQAA